MKTMGSGFDRMSLLLALSLLACSAASSQVIYVDCNAPGPGHDGTTWDTAFLAIQEGVDAATPSGEVWVADGTYVEDVVMGSGVQLYGGFLGAEEGGYEDSLDQRDFVNNVTTIDGNHSGSCVVMAAGARIDGFTLTNGIGTLLGGFRRGGGVYCYEIGSGGAIANNDITGNSVEYHGGGIYCYDSSPEILDNDIGANSAVKNGGGIACEWYAAPTVAGNTIEVNSADFGGGIYSHAPSLTVTGNSITGNTAGKTGGGMYLWECTATVEGNTIADNEATSYSGGIHCQNASPAITDNEITGNTAGGHGGGLYCNEDSSATVTDNTFAHNVSGDRGGGVRCDESSATVIRNTFDHNSADTYGGAIDCYKCSPDITDNVLTENSAANGGGLHCYESSPDVFRNTIAHNAASESGGGIYCQYSSWPAVADGLIAHNTADQNGGGMYCRADSRPTVSNCEIAYNSAVGNGGGIYCNSMPNVLQNSIVANQADYGGGLYCDEFAPTISQNTIVGNVAETCGGGLYCNSSSPFANDNVVSCNTADYGGGMYLFAYSGPSLTNNTIWSNAADFYGGGIYCAYSSPPVSNCIVVENSAGTDGGGIFVEHSTPTLSHNDFWANTPNDYDGCDPGPDDISADPMLVDPDHGDWHLAFSSPCIDAGDNAAPNIPSIDWEDEQRIINGTADIGADEYTTIYTEAPDPQPECDGPLFGGSQAGFPAWVWFSIPLTPADSADPNDVLGFESNGKLYRYDKYIKAPIVYQPPFSEWETAVGDSYILWLDGAVANPSYEGLSPFCPCEFEFRLGRQGWTWIGMPGLTELGGDNFMSSVEVLYPSDDTGEYRTAQDDYDAIPDNWITWGWPYWNTWLQAVETFTPYAPFGHRTCHPWVGYRVWVLVGTATEEGGADQVTLIWPRPGG